MIKKKPNIIREPYGPDGTRGFKNRGFRQVPLTEEEIKEIENTFVVKEAVVPEKYLLRDIWLSKVNDTFKKIRVYITNNQVLIYDLDYRLIKIICLADGYEIKRKIINNNYYAIFCRIIIINGKESFYDSTMYRIKDQHRLNQFWRVLTKIHQRK